jgi:YD repeat-containing protein
MLSVAVVIALLGPQAKDWPPPSPTVKVADGILAGAQLAPVPAEPASSMCAKETHRVENNDCKIVRADGGAAGFSLLGSSKQQCEVSAESAEAEERRWVFGENGRLREEIRIDKRTSKAGGTMYRWSGDELVRIEHWADFKSGKPTRSESFVYDAGKVVEVSTEASPWPARRFLHAWHDGKIRTTTQVANGSTWAYDYDKGRISVMTEKVGPNDPAIVTRYSYDKKGRLVGEERLIADVRVSWIGWSYDKKGRLVSRALDKRGKQVDTPTTQVTASGETVTVPAQRPDGQWDSVTRYFYACDWIQPPAPPTVDAQPTELPPPGP